MQITSVKRVIGATLASCFLVACASTQDPKSSLKSSAITPALLDMADQYVPIGTATLVNDKTAITHAWFIHASRGQPIVCVSGFTQAPENLKATCMLATPPSIPAPAPPGVRYRGLGVSSVFIKDHPLGAQTQAWYIDEFTSQVYVCEAISDMRVFCAQADIPR